MTSICPIPRVRAGVVVWSDPLIVAGRGSHVDDLLRAAGGDNLAFDSERPYPTYSVERLLARAPVVVIVGSYADGKNSAEALAARLHSVPAVRQGWLRSLDGDLLYRPGPRAVDAIERLAEVLHGKAIAGGASAR